MVKDWTDGGLGDQWLWVAGSKYKANNKFDFFEYSNFIHNCQKLGCLQYVSG
jgi:hypothetical protein